MKSVTFLSVPVGQFFKESSDSKTWMLKISSSQAEYTSNHIRAKCNFDSLETVYIEA